MMDMAALLYGWHSCQLEAEVDKIKIEMIQTRQEHMQATEIHLTAEAEHSSAVNHDVI